MNRRYQRKLVWTVEEKQSLVDSIDKDLPLPLFLVAEIGVPGDLRFELIDGMQRLNAIFSFIENEFPLGEEYFDLEALADTKNKKDENRLIQKTPVMPRERAVRFVNYQIALSVFRSINSDNVDEVFRRINSGGRSLSSQELRQAGTTSELANLVRIISSRIRGDTSPGDIVPLRAMPMLSITNKELNYGVSVNDIFWVKQGILRSGDVRKSEDEQLILDLLIDILIDPVPNSGTTTRDAYYGYGDDEEDVSLSAATIIEGIIQTRETEPIIESFLSVHDEIRETIRLGSKKFTNILGVGSGGRYPRYYHTVFFAIYELTYRDGMRVKDREKLLKLLTNISKGKSKKLVIPSGGGDWQKDSKRKTVDAVKGVLRSAFEPRPSGDDVGRHGYASDLETLLSNALVEQQTFDCKQGLLTFNTHGRDFDREGLKNICRTLVAMANMGPNCVGYVAIGIADDQDAAKRVETLDKVSAIPYRRFYIVGIDREAVIQDRSLNEYWPWLLNQVKNVLPPELSATVGADSRIVNYHGRSVGLLKVRAREKPMLFQDVMVERSGSSTVDVPRAQESRVYERFYKK